MRKLSKREDYIEFLICALKRISEWDNVVEMEQAMDY